MCRRKKRIALLIGNRAYDASVGVLKNPHNGSVLRRRAAADAWARAEDVEARVMQGVYTKQCVTKNVKKWVKRQYGAQSSARCNGGQE